LTAGTIAANSITIGGVATNHAAVTVGASGAFGGVNTYLVVSPVSNVPFGPAAVVIGNSTFNYAKGNIATGPGAYGGALISSIIGTSGVGTGVVTTDASSYKPGSGFTVSTTSPAPAQNTIGVFGYGFVPGNAITITPSVGTVTALTAPGNADPNGAFWSTQTLADTPWSVQATPTTAQSYNLVVTEAVAAPADILSPTFGITPWIVVGTTGTSATTVDYTFNGEFITPHGFGATDLVTMTIGATAMVSGGTCTVGVTTGTCVGGTAVGTVPDLAGGKQNVGATGSISGAIVTLTGGVTYDPVVNFASGQSLSINTGGAGQTTILRTGVGYGVHGLLASTVYNIVWNAISGSITVGTFTSTATGGVPIPGTQFTIPSDSSGVHILDLQTAAGASALYGGTVKHEVTPNQGFFSPGTIATAYGDMLFNNIALLQASPSVAVIGSAETLSGSGLAAGATYVIALSGNANNVATSASALGTFVATSTGAVPAGVTISLTDTPTGLETGTLMYFQEQTSAHFGVVTAPDATAQFVLAASASLNSTSAPTGHAVTISAHALNPNGVYTIVFNYVQSIVSPVVYTGTPVGVVAPNSVGAGSASFNVPASATSGTYIVQLVTNGGGGAPTGTAVLDIPLSLTVGGTSGTCTNEGTGCMGVSGTPSVTKSGGNTLITASFTNNSNAPQTAYIYAVVHNALGQTVAYTTATISPSAGGTQAGQLVLFGLAPGTYSATLFVVSTSGTALSTTSNVSVTI